MAVGAVWLFFRTPVTDSETEAEVQQPVTLFSGPLGEMGFPDSGAGALGGAGGGSSGGLIAPSEPLLDIGSLFTQLMGAISPAPVPEKPLPPPPPPQKSQWQIVAEMLSENYQTELGRKAVENGVTLDPGVNYWVSEVLENGKSIAEVMRAITYSPEAQEYERKNPGKAGAPSFLTPQGAPSVAAPNVLTSSTQSGPPLSQSELTALPYGTDTGYVYKGEKVVGFRYADGTVLPNVIS